MEPGLAELLQRAKANGLLRATESCAEAVAETDLSLVCVGTPSTVTGALDLQYVRRVTAQIAAALARKRAPHTLVFRSTMLPGSTARLVDEFLTGPLAPAVAEHLLLPRVHARRQRLGRLSSIPRWRWSGRWMAVAAGRAHGPALRRRGGGGHLADRRNASSTPATRFMP